MKKIQLLIIALLLLVPAVAFAQDTTAVTTDSVAFQLVNHVAEIAGALLMVLASWATHKFSGWLKAKTGVEVDGVLTSYAEKGVNYAEEKAHQYLASKNEAMKGPEKLEAALGFAMDLAEKNNLPTWAKDKLVNYIEAKLGETR